MLIAGCEVEGGSLLPLVLTQLIVGVGDLEPIARSEDIEMESIPAIGLVVKPVENSSVVSDGVDRA